MLHLASARPLTPGHGHDARNRVCHASTTEGIGTIDDTPIGMHAGFHERGRRAGSAPGVSGNHCRAG